MSQCVLIDLVPNSSDWQHFIHEIKLSLTNINSTGQYKGRALYIHSAMKVIVIAFRDKSTYMSGSMNICKNVCCKIV